MRDKFIHFLLIIFTFGTPIDQSFSFIKNEILMKRLISLLLLISTISLFSQTGTKKITLDDIFKNRRFSSRAVSGLNSMKDGEHYCQLKTDSLNIYEYSTGKLTQTLVTAKKLIPAGDTAPISMGSYSFSMDETKILFSTDE